MEDYMILVKEFLGHGWLESPGFRGTVGTVSGLSIGPAASWLLIVTALCKLM
jgi:hypothetical protein